jgi:hypothetical protein
MNTQSAWASAVADANLLTAFETIKREQGLSGNQAAALLGRSPAWFSINYRLWKREGVAGLVPMVREIGAQRHLFKELPGWFVPVLRFFWLLTNRTRLDGSIPEAIRRTIDLPKCPPAVQGRLMQTCQAAGWTAAAGEKLPTCPAEVRASVIAREAEGKPMLPASITRQIPMAAPFVRHHRNPKGAALDYVSGAGTQMWMRDAAGEAQFIRAGDVVECDDATVNFPVCVPWEIRGCPCSEKFAVKVGRFQWLVSIDAGSRKILGFSYTARPKSSYRAEDVLSLMRIVTQTHGVPKAWRLEKGIWHSGLVTNAVKMMGAEQISVHSPHAKPFIEGLFNQLWTKLSISFPDASVGRYRGENLEAGRLLVSCQAGQADPRRHFPMLADVIAAFQEVIQAHNSHIVRSENYGEWIPDERWLADTAARPLARLSPYTSWMFLPCAKEWQVHGNNVGGRMPMFPGCSVPFNFSAPWLLHHHGRRVKCYFDPSEQHCIAKVVLCEDSGGHRAGEVLGDAVQTNKTTDYVRAVMCWRQEGEDAGAGQLREAHTALRRETRAVVGLKSPIEPASETEVRDGAGNLARMERGMETAPPAIAKQDFPRIAAPITLTSRTGKIARLPHEVREQLNQKIRNGEIGRKICEWVNSLPEVQSVLALEFRGKPITEQNLSEWRKGGYREWLGYQVQEARKEGVSDPFRGTAPVFG